MNPRLPFRPLFGLDRDGVLEVEVFGVYFAAKDINILTPETSSAVIVSRSLLKPWQLGNCAGALDEQPHWAIGMSSSDGEPLHLAALASICSQTGLDTEALICPPTYSAHQSTRSQQIVAAESPLKKYHFCCGNHLVMQHACMHYGYDISDYYCQDNPIHLRLISFIESRMGGVAQWVTDSCGLPTLVTSMQSYMHLWQGLGNNNCGIELDRVKRLWIENPVLIGGSNRIDSMIVQSSQGKILAKEGADGLIAVQSLEDDPSQNFTVLIKLAQGAPDNYLLTALGCVLEKHYEVLPKSMHDLFDFIKANKSSALPATYSLHNFLVNSI